MKTVLLGDVIKLEYGKPLSQGDRNPDGKYPAYGANGIKARTGSFYFSKPSIIVGRKGSAGELTLTEEKFWPLDVTYFVTYDEKKYDLKYIYNLLSTLDLPSLAKGVKPGINRNEVYSLKINDPGPIEEQRRIVEKLDEALAVIDKAKQNTEKNFQSASELFNSILKSEFDKDLDKFEPRELGQIFSFKNGRSFGKSEWSKVGLPIIRIQNLKNPNAEFNYYQGEYSKEIKIEDGDLLFSWSGTVGTSFGPHFWHGPIAVLNQHIFKLNKLVDIDEVYAYFALKLITSEIEKRTHGAGGLVHVTKPTLQKFEIPLPPLEDQIKIARYLEEAQAQSQRLRERYRKKLEMLQELRQSILKQAFEGRL